MKFLFGILLTPFAILFGLLFTLVLFFFHPIIAILLFLVVLFSGAIGLVVSGIGFVVSILNSMRRIVHL